MEEVFFISTTISSFHFTNYTGHVISEALKRAALVWRGGNQALIHCSLSDEKRTWKVQLNTLKKKTYTNKS